uniref:maturase K n=1 Tax=Impatiens davidii TaxID=253001 RepID=UPI001D12BCA7|nr:maturase K [Impatiens davidii]UBA17469.1 maturase K [Impatiens davidii]
MEEFKRYLELDSSQQQDFLYSFSFQESIYTLAHVNRSILNADSEKKSSLLIVKSLITQMYQQNHLLFSANDPKQNLFFGHNTDFYCQILFEAFAVVLEIPFSLRERPFIERREIVQFFNLRSIHSIFTFLEDRLSHSNYVVDILLPHSIHLEILVQTLRYWVKDASSLHLLRFFLHQYHNQNSFIIPKQSRFVFFKKTKRNKRFFFFLYNSKVCEYESIFVFLRNQSFHLRSISSEAFLERIYFYEKIENFLEVCSKDFKAFFWLFKDLFMHYVRYKGKLILVSKGTSFLMSKWKYYLVNLWQSSFYMWSQPGRIQINQFSNYSLDFLGYLSSVQRNPSMTRSQMLENSFLISLAIKKFDTRVPTIPLIRSLSKAKFSNVLGYPISKASWADLSDSNIIDRFGRIYRNLSHYHSGSPQKTSLYKVKYILRLSCVRTLARKHKSKVRAFLKRLGSVLLEEFFMEEELVLPLNLQKISSTLWRFYGRQIWYLDLFCIDDLANSE